MLLQKAAGRKKKWICQAFALVSASLLTGLIAVQRGMVVEARTLKAQEKLADEVLRFHVRANSDSEEDQAVKMQVKEAVLAYMKQEMPKSSNVEETKAWVTGHMDDLKKVAEETLREEGSSDQIKVKLMQDRFPAKTYGDVTFPAGEYEALRIEIGAAAGQNWWCCLYPNLCFIDATHAVVPEEGKEELKEVLDDDEYEMVTASSDFKIKWFFFGDKDKKDR